MALFDNINSRYTQSMAEGGTYQRDASVGGYSRKELRGLSKQAKSGTLTQRERARYEHLRGERKGRRKRGLLAGLGGAAALAGGLAAAGKLGGGGGGGGGGLMDSIKNRLQARTERKAEEEQFNRRDANLQQELRDDNLASAIEGSEDQETFSREGFDDLSDMPLEEEGDIEGENSGEELGRQAAEMRAARDAERARIDADLAKNVDFKSNDIYGRHSLSSKYGGSGSEGAETYGPLLDHGEDTQDRSMFNEGFGEGDLYEQQTGMPVRRDGPRAKFGMKVGTPKQQKIDRLRKFMKNRYR